MELNKLIKDLKNVNIDDICSSWKWLLRDQYQVFLVSVLGDLFLLGKDDAIYWLQSDIGSLKAISVSKDEFEKFLEDDSKVDEWFLPLFVNNLIDAGITLNENEVYSPIIPAVLGGKYTTDNYKATYISVHFSFCSQINEQIKGLPDGTSINVVDFLKNSHLNDFKDTKHE